MSSAAPATPVAFARLALLAAAAVVIFAGTLWFDTRWNQFPFFYHPDEPDKVDQLITGKWNFHHPLLMLGTAEAAKRALGVADHEQALVVLGRWCSACFAAGGVAAFALLGWRTRGWRGFWVVGAALATQHQVYELAHYFKEDTALFFAMGLGFLALHIHHRRPGMASAVFAGGACGLAVSAKYLGVVMLVPAAVIMIAAQRGKRVSGGQWAWYGGAFVAVAAGINWPVFAHLDIFTHSVGRETTLLAQGERSYSGGQVAIFEYFHMFLNNTTPVVWALVAAEMRAQWKRRDAFEWTMAIFPFAFTLLLSCSPKTNDRYFLPATAGFYYLAALGALDLPLLLSRFLAGRFANGVVFLGAIAASPVLLIAGNLVCLAPYARSFGQDDRGEMLAWIRANVPASAVIGAEDHADLPISHRPERLAVQPLLAQRVIETKYAADLAPTPASLAGHGVDYIVVSESDYGIFLRKAASGHLSGAMQVKRDFYNALFRDYQPLWERARGTGIYLHPGLRVYRVGGG